MSVYTYEAAMFCKFRTSYLHSAQHPSLFEKGVGCISSAVHKVSSKASTVLFTKGNSGLIRPVTISSTVC